MLPEDTTVVGSSQEWGCACRDGGCVTPRTHHQWRPLEPAGINRHCQILMLSAAGSKRRNSHLMVHSSCLEKNHWLPLSHVQEEGSQRSAGPPGQLTRTVVLPATLEWPEQDHLRVTVTLCVANSLSAFMCNGALHMVLTPANPNFDSNTRWTEVRTSRSEEVCQVVE